MTEFNKGDRVRSLIHRQHPRLDVPIGHTGTVVSTNFAGGSGVHVDWDNGSGANVPYPNQIELVPAEPEKVLPAFATSIAFENIREHGVSDLHIDGERFPWFIYGKLTQFVDHGNGQRSLQVNIVLPDFD